MSRSRLCCGSVLALVAIALVLAAGCSSSDNSKAENKAYNEGFAAGKKAARENLPAKFGDIRSTGYHAGYAAGGRAPLAGFNGWTTGTPYVVVLQNGKNGIPWEVQSRQHMQAGQLYQCDADSCDITSGSSGAGISGAVGAPLSTKMAMAAQMATTNALIRRFPITTAPRITARRWAPPDIGVTGDDPYGLDGNYDGVGCESY
jgi:hypothetical protein